MTAGQLKGTLLEYIVRSLMINCGFTSVKADGHYVFAQRGTGLFFINGKGAAHDADVLMEPPIQMPFSYPSRLLFECKSYDKTIGLNVVRNVLGLRYDINEFEIVTDLTIAQRQKNRRASYAIANRKRYFYQVGVASVEEFSKPAFEFAANNKIPLLSMRWFLDDSTCDLFHAIDNSYIRSMPRDILNALYEFLKDKRPDARDDSTYSGLHDFLQMDEIVGEILTEFERVINSFVVGLLETGDLLFMFTRQGNITDFFTQQSGRNNLEARLRYFSDDPTKWTLEIHDYRYNSGEVPYRLEFKVPVALVSQWKAFNFDKVAGYNLKSEFFSRIFIFSQRASSNYGLPFTLINIDSQWLDNLRSEE
ncbi:hypothetical protein BDE36_2416 [Arcticibacter tournemirensis]|uniref:Restriction endonuclease n=1 Tax=Arcticibacter tournemirensis TaxID=699437 RepID=A0A5M9GZD0_9SPHI|nr:hypothetical protein [Arcticibacter tournemirensis]KAA8480062.1 hypothetical protein F1649_15670 [Arcticibacter tournemirensis]TQM50662.1 hypothetical protein BDE36_2416 [Arcticibacter tournemirensis]